jgi:CheY-like chemotaxis protein
MATQTLKLLHVEDNLAHRRLVGYYLNALPDLTLQISYADSEDQAVDLFQKAPADFVLLDYHLTQGNGLNCLKRLRQIDPAVPIVALSGAATPEIAAELLQVGADDYLSKQDLNRETLTQCLTNALRQSKLYKDTSPTTTKIHPLETNLMAVCRTVVESLPPAFLNSLDDFEKAAKQVKVKPAQLRGLFQNVCQKLSQGRTGGPPVELLLRPVLLEVILRLSEEEDGQ